VSDTRIHVTARLSETENGSILWSKTYDNDLRSRDIFAIQSDVAAQVATAVAQPYGIIYEADAASAPPEDLAAYHCTLQFYVYHAQLSAEQHAIARDCLERAVASFPTYATAWSMLSIAYLDEDRFGFNRRAGSPPPLERSLTAARRAVELDSHNIRALQALMNALFFNQQLAESIQVGEKALAINPNDTEFLGEFGARLALGGQWKRGATLLQEALARNPAASGYFHGTLAFSAYMLDDNAKALAEIRQANLNELPIFHLIAALVYAQNGLADDAAREGDAFNKMRPDFLPNLDAELMKRNIQPEDRLRIVVGLRKAGLLPLQDPTSGISGSRP
jgi:tetratricopeptide (TPR) repeat protein